MGSTSVILFLLCFFPPLGIAAGMPLLLFPSLHATPPHHTATTAAQWHPQGGRRSGPPEFRRRAHGVVKLKCPINICNAPAPSGVSSRGGASHGETSMNRGVRRVNQVTMAWFWQTGSCAYRNQYLNNNRTDSMALPLSLFQLGKHQRGEHP
jgi:hypothetical protein